ncbi:MAG: putative toxin-antitoxin system toxin component, PIN family [Steroidobacteraceae bacterium]|nr:putative toxin-antitoxin system toxin component, PIN family [Steroidobacteraceae bacterium]
MRIALDSSVLVAAHISRAGVCAELLEELLLHHELVTSDFIIEEVARKLFEKFDFLNRDCAAVAEFLRRASTVVTPTQLPADVCRDADDIAVLGTAKAGECRLLISVDRDLLDRQQFEGTAIVRPGEFWRRTAEPTSGAS